MIILFYSNECKFCIKLLEYLKKNNLERYFKMINIMSIKNIPENITIVPTIIDDTIEAPLEGKQAFEYVINQKFFNYPTNNVEYWINNMIPKPNIEEDKKAIDKHNFAFASIENIDLQISDNNKIIKEQPKLNMKDKKTLALLKLKR